MKVSISKDKHGIQLCTDKEFQDHCLDLEKEEDLKDIQTAIRKYLDEKKENRLLDAREKQEKALRMTLPTIGEWVYRRFNEKYHEATGLGGPEQLDDFIIMGYVGKMGDYNPGGSWRLVKKIDIESYDFKEGQKHGVIIVEINIGVNI